MTNNNTSVGKEFENATAGLKEERDPVSRVHLEQLKALRRAQEPELELRPPGGSCDGTKPEIEREIQRVAERLERQRGRAKRTFNRARSK